MGKNASYASESRTYTPKDIFKVIKDISVRASENADDTVAELFSMRVTRQRLTPFAQRLEATLYDPDTWRQ